MGQHGPFEGAQLRAGIEAQLVEQVLTCVSVGAQRVRLALAPVQGDDQLGAEAFAQRVPADELDQGADDLGVMTSRQLGVDQALLGAQDQLVQTAPQPRGRTSGR